MRRPLDIVLLELRRFLADGQSLAFGIALPIVLFAVMYAAFGGGASFNGKAHIADVDRGELAQELLMRLKEVEGLDVKVYAEAELNDALDRSAILMGVVIPAGFTEDIRAGRTSSVIFRRRGSGGQEGEIVASIVRGVAQSVAGEAMAVDAPRRALAALGASEGDIDAALSQAAVDAAALPPIVVRSARIGVVEDYGVKRALPGILVMILMLSVTLSSRSFVEERRAGTLERLLTTQLGVGQLFAGKFLAGVVRAAFQALFLLALAFIILRPGDATALAQMMAVCLLVAGATSAVSLLIGAVSKTPDQAAWAAVTFTMVMTVFGGAFFEIGAGSPLDIMSRFTITRYAIAALSGVVDGADTLGAYAVEMGILTAAAIVGVAAARWLFRTTEGGN